MSSIQVTSTTWKNRKSKGENRETTRPKKLIAFLLARPKWK
jgi:hypothetical protein